MSVLKHLLRQVNHTAVYLTSRFNINKFYPGSLQQQDTQFRKRSQGEEKLQNIPDKNGTRTGNRGSGILFAHEETQELEFHYKLHIIFYPRWAAHRIPGFRQEGKNRLAADWPDLRHLYSNLDANLGDQRTSLSKSEQEVHTDNSGKSPTYAFKE